MHADNVPVTDYHNFVHRSRPQRTTTGALLPHVSFDVRWSGTGTRQTDRDETFGFTVHYVNCSATISYTASNDGEDVIYSSDAAGQYNVGQPGGGHERNGAFFR